MPCQGSGMHLLYYAGLLRSRHTGTCSSLSFLALMGTLDRHNSYAHACSLMCICSTTASESQRALMKHPCNPNNGWGDTQVAENLKSLEVLPKLTPDVLDKIDAIMQSAPDAPASFR